jgi:hypothetical protein
MNRTKLATVLLILFILPCILFVSGCGTTNQVVPKSFHFDNAVLNYETGDEFSVDGLELIITYSDNSTEKISITPDMIKQMPDMSTPGEKTIIIIYKGVEYSFKINVVQNQNVFKQEMLAKLQAFLSDYQRSGKITKINAAAIVNLVAQFLGDEESLDEIVYEFNINPESGVLENVVYNKIYEIIRDAIINNSFDIDISQILSASGLQARLDYLKTLQDILLGFKDTDYKVLFTAFATSEENIQYVSLLTDKICEIFKITSDGKAEIQDILLSLLEDPQLVAFVTNFNLVIQTYSELDADLKAVIDNFAQAALSDADHCLSLFFLSLSDFVSITDAEENYVTTEEAEDLKAAYMANFADIITEFEDIILREDLDTAYLSNAINNIITYCGNISQIEITLESNDWNFNGPVLPVPPGELKYFLSVARAFLIKDDIVDIFINDVLLCQDNIDNYLPYLTASLCDFLKISEEGEGVVESILISIIEEIKNFETIDSGSYITQLNDAIQTYSELDANSKILIDNFAQAALSDADHCLSLFFLSLSDYDSLDNYVSPEMKWQIIIYAQYLSGDNYHHEAILQMTNSDNFTVTEGYEQFIIPAGDVKNISLTLTTNRVWDSDYFVMFANGYTAQELLNIFSYYDYVAEYRCEGEYLYIYPENYYCSFFINSPESDLVLNIQAVYDLDYLTQSMKCDLNVFADYKLPVITVDAVSSYIYTLLKGEEITEDLIQDLRETLIIENILEKINLNHNDYSYILPATDSYTFYLNGEFNRITVPAGNVEFKINLWANINSDCNYYYIIKSEGYSAEDLLEMIYKDYNVKEYNAQGNYLYIKTNSYYYNTEIYFKCNLISDLVLDVQAVYDTEFLCNNNRWSVYATATYEPYSYVYSNLKNLPMTVPAKDAFQEITVPAGNVHINLDLQLDQFVRKFYFVIRSEGYSGEDLLSLIYNDYNVKEYACEGENLYIVPELYYNRWEIYLQHDFASDFVLYIEAIYDFNFEYSLDLDLNYKISADYINDISSYLYDILKDGEADNTEILQVIQDLNLVERFFENFILNNYLEEKSVAVTSSENFTLSEGFTQILIPSGNKDIDLNFYINMDCPDCFYVIYAEGYSGQDLLSMISDFSGIKEIIAEGEYLYVYSINDFYSYIKISHNFRSDLMLYIQVVCDKFYYSENLICYFSVDVYSRLPEEFINLISGYVYNLIEGEEILISDVIESLRNMNFIEGILRNINTERDRDYYYQPMTISDNFIETEGYTEVDISSGNAKVVLRFDKYGYTENDYVVMYAEGYSAQEILDMIILDNNIKDYSCSGQYLYFTPARSSFEIILKNNFETDVVFNIQNVYEGSVFGDVPYWMLNVYSEYKLPEDVVNMISTCIYDGLSLLYNGDSFETYIKGIIDENLTDIGAQITNALSQAMGFDYGSAAYNDLSDIVETALTGYMEGTFDPAQNIENAVAFVETYCDERAKIFAYSLSALYIVTTQPDVDYNEVFSFIELPEGIESIDYNVLIAALISEQTYDVFTISDVVIQYIEDEEGNITGEKLTLSLNVDFDIMVTSLKGGVELSLEFAF